jgi:hypothetical protein
VVAEGAASVTETVFNGEAIQRTKKILRFIVVQFQLK